MVQARTILGLLAVACSVHAGASEEFHKRNPSIYHRDLTRHVRRHHAKRSSGTGKCRPKSSGSVTATASTSQATATGAFNSSSSSSSASTGNFISMNQVTIGMLPDGGGDGGSANTMASLNSAVSTLGKKHGAFGQYAQVVSGQTFDGSQLLQVMDDLVASGAVFEPAVMPTTWEGLTSDDNSNAVAIANVMKQFTDQGIQVRLRFAHEVNWYVTDGTYQGGVAEFQEGWATVAAAVKSIAPDVKMFFSPNIADLATYESWFPSDPSTVDIIGADFYPSEGSDLSSAYVSAQKPFHDKYCTEGGIEFVQGETGLGYAGSVGDRIAWLQGMVSAKTNGMPYFTSASWFNYYKGYDFKVVDPSDSSTTDAYISAVQGS